MKYKVGDIIAVRCKIVAITEEEKNKLTFRVKGLDRNYDTMNIGEDDIQSKTLIVPKEDINEKTTD